MGPPQRHSPPDGRPLHLHVRCSFLRAPLPGLRGLAAYDLLPAGARCWNVRVSDIHHAAHEPLRPPLRRWWVAMGRLSHILHLCPLLLIKIPCVDVHESLCPSLLCWLIVMSSFVYLFLFVYLFVVYCWFISHPWVTFNSLPWVNWCESFKWFCLPVSFGTCLLFVRCQFLVRHSS